MNETESNGDITRIQAYRDGTAVLLDRDDIIRLYTENRKVYIITDEGKYESRQALYELEDNLDQSCFVRLSRFEIANLRRIFSFDLSIAGTIHVTYDNSDETWVSRRYVKVIQEKINCLSKGGDGHE